MPKFLSDNVIHQSEWLRIINKSDNETVEMDIDGVIGGSFWEDEAGSETSANTMAKMKKELKAISELKAKKIIINLNSPGGYVDHGLSIHDLLAMHPAEKVVRITGMTASIATVIAMAGNTIEMSDNALFLVHRGAYGLLGHFNGNDLEGIKENLTAIDNKIIDIYHKRTKMSVKKITDIMDKDGGHGVWLNADEAKDFGFIDKIFEPMRAAAIYMNDSIINNLKLPEYKLNSDDMDNKTLLDNLKTFITDLFSKKKEDGSESETPKEVTDKLTEFENSLNTLSGENESLKIELQRSIDQKEESVNTLHLAFDAKEKDYQAKVTTLENEVTKLQAGGTKVPGITGSENPEFTGDPKMKEWDNLALEMKKFEIHDEKPDLNAKMNKK